MAIGQGSAPAGRSARAAAPAPALTARFAPLAGRADALCSEWEELTASASEPNPFVESWFVAAAARYLASERVRLAEVREGSTLLGLLPLTIERRYGRIPVRHVQNWNHANSFLGTPLVRSGEEEAFWRTLLDGLDRAPWASGFLHLEGLAADGPVARGLAAAAASLGRAAPVVHSERRAFLESSLTAARYYEQTVRKKKRKELARLRNRLAELGPLTTRALLPEDDLAAWCDDFLALERSGWKGREGTALGCDAAGEHFFREALAAAHAAGRLQLLRMQLGGRPIAMLVNFLTPPGSFSFKTAYDEEYARFSPGVLIQIENLRILEQPGIAWMDSCAAQDHPMIDSLWAERRTLVRVTLPLRGPRRRLTFAAARALEKLSAARRRAAPPPPSDGDET